MGFFNRNKQPTAQPDQVSKVEAQSAIEIVAHKNAKADVVKKAEQVNKQLNQLLIDNGFTLKIFLAAGGGHPQRKQRK